MLPRSGRAQMEEGVEAKVETMTEAGNMDVEVEPKMLMNWTPTTVARIMKVIREDNDKGKGVDGGHSGNKGGCNSTIFSRGTYHWRIGRLIGAYATKLGNLDWKYAILLLLYLSLFFGPHINWKTKWMVRTRNRVRVVSKRTIQVAKAWQSPNLTQLRVYGYNDMDTRVDTCCTGANFKLVSFSNEVCKVSQFLDSYQTVKEILVARVSTVWIGSTTLREYLIVVDHFLWFGTMMNHSIINPN